LGIKVAQSGEGESGDVFGDPFNAVRPATQLGREAFNHGPAARVKKALAEDA
jgi:hypothetical protein